MSEQSEREWKSYLLSKGVFANALRFAHLEKPEEVDRTSRLGLRVASIASRKSKIDLLLYKASSALVVRRV